jgi:tRNA nucleotidyltransferase (CCA-adding enzyme)
MTDNSKLYYTWLNGDLELPFQLYLVGGAVRDSLMGREPKDRDFVAVGATLDTFQNAFPGSQAVGKSFPVFLVPGLGEVAFARLERKLGPYHTDFEVLFDPTVTLEQDLERRDLTINAIAMRHDGSLIDPFGGASDLGLKVLRHVGPAFSEDALRVFRLARFAAQLDFVIAPETMRFAKHVPLSDLTALPAERVCEEFRKALRSANPRRFIEELERMGVLAMHFPELAHLRVVPAGPPEHHPEGDALTHSLMVLDEAVRRTEREDVRLAALFHDLGKSVTPPEKWPSHHDHDNLGVPVVGKACDRLKLPTGLKMAAIVACREHMRVHKFLEMRKGKMVDLVMAADKCSLKAEGLAMVCVSDHEGRGRKVMSVRELPSGAKIVLMHPIGLADGAEALAACAPACRAEKGHPIPPGLLGKNIGLHVRNKKGNAIRAALKAAGKLNPKA